MTRSSLSGLALVLATGLCSVASADITYINTVGNGNVGGAGSGSRAEWTAALGGNISSVGSVTSGALATDGGVGVQSGALNFTSGVTASVSIIYSVPSQPSLSAAGSGFFIGNIDSAPNMGTGGIAAGLGNGYFDGGDAAQPTTNPIALGFGNSDFYHANGLRIDFNPGISAFGFNYDDVGDVGAVLEVTWSDNTTQLVTLGSPDAASPLQDGFFGLIRTGASLLSISFVQNPGVNNDGFALYNFTSSPAVVPLPPAAYAGLASLAGVFVIARRRNKKASAV